MANQNPYDFTDCPNYSALQAAEAAVVADPSEANAQAYMEEVKTALEYNNAKFSLDI